MIKEIIVCLKLGIKEIPNYIKQKYKKFLEELANYFYE